MEFTKKDAPASDRLRNLGKRAQVCESCRLLRKKSRHLMEQIALLKHDIGTFKSKLATIGIQNYPTGVAHARACAPLCPAVWSMLPVELLERIFARLPFPDIIRLRVLSMTWDRCVTGVTPGFTKLCAERNPNMFALISEGDFYDGDDGPMVMKLYDSKDKKWHHFVPETSVLETCETRFAGDGGLVCLVSNSTATKGMKIVVFNPLTRQWRELPLSSSLSRILPHLIQLVMDRESKCYKVLVVGNKKQSGGDAVARMFSSVTGKWSKPNIFSDLIFGCQYSWKNGPLAYDCASSTLLKLDEGSYPSRYLNKNCVLVKDRLFVLDVNHSHEHVLTEYQAQRFQPHWVRLKVHKCSELDEVSGYEGDVELETGVFGCQDFLVVNAYGGRKDDFPHKRTILFDLSTSQWQIISEIPEWYPIYPAPDMFELRWDAVP